MKRRNKEVNIFNMSILDVLCGALGAFCFMMLALFPYYKPTHLSAEDRKSYQDAQQMQQRLQRLQQELRDAGPAGAAAMIQKIEQALQEARQQLAQAQENLSRTRAAMEQAQEQAQRSQQQAQQATQEANHANNQLSMKQPLVVQNWWVPATTKVTMYIHNPAHGEDGKTAPPFDPNKDQGNFFKDTSILEGPGSSSWVIGDTVPGQYAIYYRIDQPQTATGEVEVLGRYEYGDTSSGFAIVKLTAAHPYAEVGAVIVDAKQRSTSVSGPGIGSASSSPSDGSPSNSSGGIQTPP